MSHWVDWATTSNSLILRFGPQLISSAGGGSQSAPSSLSLRSPGAARTASRAGVSSRLEADSTPATGYQLHQARRRNLGQPSRAIYWASWSRSTFRGRRSERVSCPRAGARRNSYTLAQSELRRRWHSVFRTGDTGASVLARETRNVLLIVVDWLLFAYKHNIMTSVRVQMIKTAFSV